MKKSIIISLACLTYLACSTEPSNDSQSNVATPYVTQVLDFMPAPGQYTNTLPTYEEGDTQEDINLKVLERIGNNASSTISLGGYGGYVVVGFDHTIENRAGVCDFRVTGNAYYATATDDSPAGGSCEAGIIMVSRDSNGNGIADDEWYEIAGSSHNSPTDEAWHTIAQEAGNDVDFHSDYQITYHAPTSEDIGAEYIYWSDNKGAEGYLSKNQYHTQSYFPQWVDCSTLTFSGSRLPENGVLDSDNTTFVLYKFGFGYADNDTNISDGSAIDIAWAIDSAGDSVQLDGVDFIKIYTAVNQLNGWLGETSTEITGVEDLHLLEVEILSL